MGQFLNNKEPYDKFKTVMNGTYFVDKLLRKQSELV